MTGEVAHDTERCGSGSELLGPLCWVIGTSDSEGRWAHVPQHVECVAVDSTPMRSSRTAGRQPSAGGQTTTAICGVFVLQTA